MIRNLLLFRGQRSNGSSEDQPAENVTGHAARVQRLAKGHAGRGQDERRLCLLAFQPFSQGAGFWFRSQQNLLERTRIRLWRAGAMRSFQDLMRVPLQRCASTDL